MSENWQTVLSLIGATFFMIAAVVALKTGRLASIRGGTVRREGGRPIFAICVSGYFAIAAFLVIGVLVW